MNNLAVHCYLNMMKRIWIQNIFPYMYWQITNHWTNSKLCKIWVTQNISNKYFDFMQNQGLTYEFLLLLLLKITHIYICNFFRLLDLGNLWCRVRIPNNLNFSLIWSTTQYKQKQIVCSGKRLQNKSLVPYITLFW